VEQRQAVFPVEAGALEDGRHRGRRLVIGIGRWLPVVALIVSLAVSADEAADAAP
jgi:hypothetical protein